jgi:ParB family chromosome partitioning protein
MTQQTRRALGRGLEALLPEVGEISTRQVVIVGIDKVDPNPFQPRHEWDDAELQSLSDSIRAQGILQPLVLRKTGGRFQVIAGERRLRASRMAGLTEIPAVVREADDAQMLALALVENLQRKDLGPMEKAEAFSRLGSTFGLTQDEMGRQTGLGRSTVANFMRLLELPEEVKGFLRTGSLSMGHGRAILGLRGRHQMEAAAKLAVKRSYSVRQLEEHIRRLSSPAGGRKRERVAPPEVRALEDRLQRVLGTRVRIVAKGRSGRIEVDFSSLDELDRILELIGGS